MNKNKYTHLKNLPDGSPFLVREDNEQFKYMYLIRGGDSTCKVQGFKKNEDKNYVLFVDFFSPATEVYSDMKRKILTINKNGLLSIPDEFNISQSNTKKEKKEKMNNTTTKNSIGRPKKHRIVLPMNVEMTAKAMAEQLGVEKFVVNNELARIRKETPNKIQIVGSLNSTTGKGKPAKVFKISI